MTESDPTSTPDKEARCSRDRTGLPRPRKRHWRVVMLMLLIFIAGGVLGAAGTIIYTVHHLQEIGQHPERAPQRITQRMREKLDLTDAQAEAVQEILERRQHELMAIRREIHPRVKAIMDASRDEIAEVLTDDQQVKWKQMYEQFDRRWMGRFSNGHRHPRRHHGRGPSEDAPRSGQPAEAPADAALPDDLESP